jgi:hypothetical protein
VLNVFATAIFVVLFGLTMRGGAHAHDHHHHEAHAHHH